MQLSQPGDVPTWTLGDRLRKAREHANLRQEELAAELGISRASVSVYESGHRPPMRSILLAWAMVCHVDLDWLTGSPGCFPGQAAALPTTTEGIINTPKSAPPRHLLAVAA